MPAPDPFIMFLASYPLYFCPSPATTTAHIPLPRSVAKVAVYAFLYEPIAVDRQLVYVVVGGLANDLPACASVCSPFGSKQD